MSCSILRKPVPTQVDRGGTLRYAWLRAPPLHQTSTTKPSKSGCLTTMPHMRVGKGAKRRAHAVYQHEGFLIRVGKIADEWK